MIERKALLARSRCESLRRLSRDWADVACSFQAGDVGRRVRDLNHPPSMKKTMRTAGIALAVAPEPLTTVAGLALVAGSFAVNDEPTTLANIAEELGRQMSEISDFDLGSLTLSI